MGIVEFRPMQLALERWLEQADYLPIDIIQRRGEKQQTTNDPPPASHAVGRGLMHRRLGTGFHTISVGQSRDRSSERRLGKFTAFDDFLLAIRSVGRRVFQFDRCRKWISLDLH